MKITAEEVIYVANLARLNLAPEEVGPTTEQLGRILAYVEKLDALNTDGVAPATHALAVTNAFRDDEVRPSLPQQEALANGPQVNGEAFVVPRVI
jgi:aspartyl-tRNA(Asn)/glutamyl-tRNA(Gln) amidotransferase subunit C